MGIETVLALLPLRRVEAQAMKNVNLKAKLESAKQEIYSYKTPYASYV